MIERNLRRKRNLSIESESLNPQILPGASVEDFTLDNQSDKVEDHFLEEYLYDNDTDIYDTKLSNFVSDNFDFDVIEECYQLINNKCCVPTYPPDSSDIIGSGSSTLTKIEFTQKLNNIILKHHMSNDAALDMLSLTRELNPDANLPLHVTNCGNIRSDIKKYVSSTNSAIYIDACENECMLFAGNNANLGYCSVCRSKRYFDCTETSCKNKLYENCYHSNRKPKKTIMYRPLLPILSQLLSYQFFLDALNYNYCKPDTESDKYEYMDVLDGSNAKEALAEMVENFKTMNFNEPHKSINLLFGIFYDGIQLYHTKTLHFWPCFLTILNLPPSMRNEIGVGMFLSTIYTGTMGSQPERFIVEHCIIKEFTSLREGFSWKLNGNYYFIQGRLIHHFLDTKALGQELNVQEANSHAGCPLCLHGRGFSRIGLNAVTYGNYRQFLSDTHFLRKLGNSMQCCPKEYWSNSKNIVSSTTTTRFNQIKLNLNDLPRSLNFKFKIVPCSNNYTEEAIDYFRRAGNLANSLPYDWYHDEIQFSKNDFKEYLHYAHALISKQVDFSRKTQIAFQKDGFNVIASGGRIKVSNGVKGVWPFSNICNVEKHVEFDPFHSVSGVCLRYLKILSAERLTNMKSFCREYNIHPYMFPEHYDKAKVPFIVNLESQRVIDACVACILIPFGHSKHFQIKNIFSDMGTLRGKDRIGIFMILIPFLNLFWNIHSVYKSFFAMFSSDLIDLYSYNISGKELDHLCNKVLETCAVHEGLFTESECSMLLHEFIHLPFHIRKMGTVYNFHTLFGERAVKNVKAFTPHGGKAFYLQILDGYDVWESNKMKDYYEDNLKAINSAKLTMVDNRLNYSEFGIQLRTKIIITNAALLKFHVDEINSFILAVVAEVYKIFDNEFEAIHSSPIYRLYSSFKFHQKKFKQTFYNWLLYIDNFNRGVNNEQLVKILENVDDYTQGSLYKIDCSAAKNLSSVTALSYYKYAIINGDKFSGRGIEFKEIMPVKRDYYGTRYQHGNSKNNLSDVSNWDQNCHSCFVRYKGSKSSFASAFGKDYYGHVNFFSEYMCLKIQACMVLHLLT